MSITPVSNIPVAIDYTGRDYYSLREDLIARIQDRIPEWTASDPADFGVALVEAFSYMGDMISFYIDRTANESFIQTATQRDSILNIAQSNSVVRTLMLFQYLDHLQINFSRLLDNFSLL